MRISAPERPAGQDRHQVDGAPDSEQGQDRVRGWAEAKLCIGDLCDVLPNRYVIDQLCRLPYPESVQIFGVGECDNCKRR